MRALPALGALFVLSTWSSPGLAGIATCLTVDGPGETRGLRDLVESELARHPSHELAEADCEARLRVELIAIAPEMGGGRYVTGWLDGEVPHRVPVGEAGVGAALEELLTVVLHNDPRRLRGPDDRSDVFGRGVRALRLEGRTHFGVEVYQVGAWVDGGVQTLPGLAAFVRREVGAVHLAVRLGGAHAFGTPAELTLKTQVIADLEGALFSSARADTAAFVALFLGYELQRFQVPSASADASGFSGGVRGGVELFRVTSTRAVLFLEARAPAFVSSDPDGDVVDQWTPSAALGAAVAF